MKLLWLLLLVSVGAVADIKTAFYCASCASETDRQTFAIEKAAPQPCSVSVIDCQTRSNTIFVTTPYDDTVYGFRVGLSSTSPKHPVAASINVNSNTQRYIAILNKMRHELFEVFSEEPTLAIGTTDTDLRANTVTTKRGYLCPNITALTTYLNSEDLATLKRKLIVNINQRLVVQPTFAKWFQQDSFSLDKKTLNLTVNNTTYKMTLTDVGQPLLSYSAIYQQSEADVSANNRQDLDRLSFDVVFHSLEDANFALTLTMNEQISRIAGMPLSTLTQGGAALENECVNRRIETAFQQNQLRLFDVEHANTNSNTGTSLSQPHRIDDTTGACQFINVLTTSGLRLHYRYQCQ